jgi:hypothetical protein
MNYYSNIRLKILLFFILNSIRGLGNHLSPVLG